MTLDLITRVDATQSLSSITSITLDADTDANGSGTIDLRTRNLTRLQITNAGNVSVINKIGVNQPVPISALHINATYAVATTATEFPIRLRPPSGAGDFLFMLNTTMFGSDRDDVVWWGWNIDGLIGADPSIHFAMERLFGTDFEIHMETQRPHGSNIIRHWTWNIHRTTGATSHTIRADSLTIQSATAGSQVLQANASEILLNHPTEVRGLTDIFRFETVNNGGGVSKQISLRSHPSDNQLGWLVFGDPGGGGGSSMFLDTSFSNTIRFRSGGSTLSDGCNLQANRFYGNAFYDNAGNVQLLGAQGAAVADATGAGDVVAQLNTLLARLRAHGLIAT